MTKEIWKDIPAHHSSYQASNLGRVRSKDRAVYYKDGRRRRFPSVMLKLSTIGRGYKTVSLSGKQKYVHRIVLETFVGPCPDGMEGCHEDDDKANNALRNLRWDTPVSNGKDRVRNGNQVSNNKIVLRSDGEFFSSLTEASKSVGRGVSAIWNACNGVSKTCAGYKWQYVCQPTMTPNGGPDA